MQAGIFIERNFGNGEGQAFPPMAFWQQWFHRRLVSKASMSSDRLTIIGRRLVFRDSQPDEDCTDPRARSPKIVMTVVMPQTVDFNCGQFDAFIRTCWNLARVVKAPGEMSELNVAIPDLLIPDKAKGKRK